ncbi:MAG: restriction endonuclease subunit S [Bacteroidetes bacterium]|nr:restriction endonuclease subunit S [Bacteroidota bacterium]
MNHTPVTQTRPGYTWTKLGWIPEEWEVVQIKDIAKVTSGGTPDRKITEYWGGKIPWITTSQVDASLIDSASEYITEEGLNNSSAKMFPAGTLLMAMYGQGITRGKVGILNINATTNQACAAILLDFGRVDTKYIFYELQRRYLYIRNLSNDGGQKNLSGELIKGIKIPLPPLPEQRAIARILSTWDQAIDTQRKLITAHQQRKKGLMQELLTGKRRVMGFEGEWKELKLGAVFERITRKNEGISNNVLTISAQHGLINQEKFFNKQVASSILDNYFLLKRGEFAYNKSYSNGYPMGAIKCLKNYENGVVTTLYICFRLRQKTFSINFFEHYFESGRLNKGLTQIAHEGGRAHGLLNVAPKDFFNLLIKIPDYKEQHAIATILQAADREIELLEAELAALQEQKKGLMQKLLMGEVRVGL